MYETKHERNKHAHKQKHKHTNTEHSVCIYLKHMFKRVFASANKHAICKCSVLMCMQTSMHAHGVATGQQTAAEGLFRLSVYQHREHTEITDYLSH